MAARPARFFALFLGLCAGLLILLAFVFLRPVEWSEAKLRFRLWKSGARPVLWEKHRGFTQDRCEGRSPADCPCVWFIHGMGDSVVTWRNFFLEPDAFGKTPVRVFAIDLPGHGGSLRRREVSEYRVSNMARELDAEIAKTAECKRNMVVGNSYGGWVASWMVLDAPKTFEHLVLISPAGLSATESETKDLFKSPTVESLKEFQRRAYFKPRQLTDREWEYAVHRMKGGSVDEIRGAQVAEDRLDGKLGKIRIDTLLVRGEADRIISRGVMDAFAKEIPQAKLETLAECGHLPQKECPARLFPLIQRVLAVPHSAP